MKKGKTKEQKQEEEIKTVTLKLENFPSIEMMYKYKRLCESIGRIVIIND